MAGSHSLLRLILATSLAVAAVGCKGQVSLDGSENGSTTTDPDDPNNPDDPVIDPTTGVEHPPVLEDADIPVQPLLRVSSEQYANILRDLFPEPLDAELLSRSIFPETTISSGFSAASSANVVNRGESNRIEDNAEALATYLLEQADTALPAVASCVDTGFTDADVDACMPAFIQEFGLRAYRRPLTDGETAIVQGVYDAMRQELSAREGWAAVMQLFLQAPALLYRTELGLAAQDGAELRPLTDYEMAVRLSFFFLNSMPDAELFAAAAAGELRTTEQVEAQARRLSQQPGVIDSLESFHRDWAQTYQLADATKTDGAFTPEVRAAMQQEMRTFVQHVYETDPRLQTLLTTNQFPVSAELGPLYGVDGADGSVQTVPNRHGFLTQVSFTASHAKEAATDPIHRGYFVLKGVLCGQVGALPEGLDLQGPLESTANEPTARQRLQPLMERNDCSGCHTVFNPIGLSLETYDELGRYRAQENGVDIDASGELLTLGADQSYEDVAGMVSLMAGSDAVHDCYVDNWYEYAMGRSIVTEEQPALEPIKERFRETDGDIRELLVAIATSPPFRFRPVAPESE